MEIVQDYKGRMKGQPAVFVFRPGTVQNRAEGGYEYEQGEYTVTRIFWNEAKEQLLTDKV